MERSGSWALLTHKVWIHVAWKTLTYLRLNQFFLQEKGKIQAAACTLWFFHPACSCKNFRSKPLIELGICNCMAELATKSSKSLHLRAGKQRQREKIEPMNWQKRLIAIQMELSWDASPINSPLRRILI